MVSLWTADFTGTFKRCYKRLSEDVRRRVEASIEKLLASEDPRREGHRFTVLGRDATRIG